MKLNARVRKLELELIQPHMAQKPLLRGEVGCACVAREVSVEKGGMGKKRKHQINRSTLPALRPLRRALLSARGGLFYSFLDPIPPPSLGGRKQLLLRLPLPLISLRLPLKNVFPLNLLLRLPLPLISLRLPRKNVFPLNVCWATGSLLQRAPSKLQMT